MNIIINERIKSALPKLSEESFQQLERNILQDGCLDPLIVWGETLIDGHNRYAICTKHDVPFKVTHMAFEDMADVIAWIEDFQAGRRNLPPDWFAYYLGKKYEREKQAHGGEREAKAQNGPLVSTAEKIASEHGVSKNTVKRAADFARDVEAIAEKVGDEARAEILDGDVKATREEVHAVAEAIQDEALTFSSAKEAFDWVKQRRQEKADAKRAARDERLVELSAGNSPLPQDRKYPIIYADPPWQYDFSPSNDRSVENHYPTMPIEEILALDVSSLATPDAMLFLWAPPSFIKKGLAVMEAWGFELATSMVWVKDKIGTGIYVRQRHEYLLLGKRGTPITPRPGSQPDSVIEAPRDKHSAKPSQAYDIIEKMYPGLPKIELFCRSPQDGWAVWGNQSEAAE